MRRHTLTMVLAVWLSALVLVGIVGCSISDNDSDDNPNNNGDMMDGSGTGGDSDGDMMDGSGTGTDMGNP